MTAEWRRPQAALYLHRLESLCYRLSAKWYWIAGVNLRQQAVARSTFFFKKNAGRSPRFFIEGKTR